MRILRLTHDEGCNTGNASAVYDAKDLASLLEEVSEMQYCEVGEKWMITVEEMPLKEFENLSEFLGW